MYFVVFYNEETSKDLGKYDIIHMNYVLEHIQNPSEILEITKASLKPEGLLCVCVPNDYNPFQMALKNCYDFNSWWFVAPHHINYFNFDSIEKLFINKGFDILGKESTFPMDMFLLMGDNYIDNSEIGRLMHKKRKNFDISINMYDKKLRNELYKKLSELNIGREIIIYGINK